MRILKLVLATLIIFFSFHADASCSQLRNVSISASISCVQTDKNIVQDKTNKPAVLLNQRNTTHFSNSRRENNDTGNNNPETAVFLNKNLQKIVDYIKNESYLENRIELALLPLLHQIQPNAP